MGTQNPECILWSPVWANKSELINPLYYHYEPLPKLEPLVKKLGAHTRGAHRKSLGHLPQDSLV